MEQSGGNDQFQYHGSTAVNPAVTPSPPDNYVAQPEQSPLMQWNASEFIDHQKDVSWFVPLFVVVIAITAVVYLLSKDILATLVILLGGITFATFAKKKPQTLTYSLLPTTIKVGTKTYSYDDFRTFSIVQEGALLSVFLEPVKRFIPPLSIYFAPEDGERIFDTLAGHIPHQERQPDLIERLMHKIRF